MGDAWERAMADSKRVHRALKLQTEPCCLLSGTRRWRRPRPSACSSIQVTVQVCSNTVGSTWVDIAAMNGFTNAIFLDAPFSGSGWRLDGFVPNPITPFSVNPTRSWMRVYFFPNAAGPIQIPVTARDLTTNFTRFGTARFQVTLTPTPILLTRVLSPQPPGGQFPPDPPPPIDIGWRPLLSWGNIGLNYTASLRLGAAATPLETKTTSNQSLRFDTVLDPITDYSLSVQGFNHCGSASTGTVQITTAQACFLVDQPIPDGGMLISSNLVAGNVAEDLRVTLSIEHPRVSDLRVSLMRLDRSAILIDQPGLPGSGCNRGGLEAVLRDSAPRSNEFECANEGPAVNGQLRPSQSLSAFEGVPASGEWTLVVEDLVGGQTGRLYEWCLSSGNSPDDAPFMVDGLFLNGFEG
jgi:subtilisin-like proprotein convertase family protein